MNISLIAPRPTALAIPPAPIEPHIASVWHSSGGLGGKERWEHNRSQPTRGGSTGLGGKEQWERERFNHPVNRTSHQPTAVHFDAEFDAEMREALGAELWLQVQQALAGKP